MSTSDRKAPRQAPRRSKRAGAPAPRRAPASAGTVAPLSADLLIDALSARGVRLYTGVPCSHLSPLIDGVSRSQAARYVPATSEGEAVALACGAWLSGSTGVVLCQNSGLGNMVNPIASFVRPFRVPVLLFVSWRGLPGAADAPQHTLMGRVTPRLLDLLEIPWRFLPAGAALAAALDEAFARMRETGSPYAFLVRPGDIAPAGAGCTVQEPPPQAPSRAEAIAAFLRAVPREAIVVSTTGKCSRELSALGDSARNLYCVGAMGYANALAHGIALGTSRPVYVLDGDGALLMHMGNVATIGFTRPPQLLHVVLDNRAYDSTGGQPTVSGSVDLAAVARACGYREAVRCAGLGEFVAALRPVTAGPRLVHLRIRGRSMPSLGRPSIPLPDLARRLRDFIGGGG